MPTYEYRCPEGHEFDHFFRSISAAQAEMPCPVCGKQGVRKVSGGAGLVFKGSGFYITDYGKDGKKDQKPAAPATDAGSSAAGASADKKAEPTKPASPPPSSSGSE